MLKFALLASAMLVSAPALAQQVPAGSPQTSTSPTQTAPTQTAPAADPMASEPTQADPAQAAPAEATPAAVTGEAQIAQVVETEFPTYDKDANGTLNTAEFGSWMVALRSATDKSVTADSKAMKTWTKTAFAQADSDKSKTVSKTELTGFLSQNKG